MKYLILLSTLLMIAPLMNGCSNGKCTLEINSQFCLVEGAKNTYSSGEHVELTLKPYPYFELPAEKFISIYGASNVDYDYANKKISFDINQNASLSFSAISSFGGKEIDYAVARQWWENNTDYGIRLDYKYSFEKVGDAKQLQIISDLINLPIATHELTDFSGEFHTSNPNKIDSTGILKGKNFGSTGSIYIANFAIQTKSTYGDEMVVYSTNIQMIKLITGVSGYAHWRVPEGGGENFCDYAYLTYNNAIVGEEIDGQIHYSDPINGYVEMQVVCGKKPTN